MQPYVILKKAGFDLLFTGIIADKVIDAINKDQLVGSFRHAGRCQPGSRQDLQRL
jgi:hypothetical protein